MFTTAELCAARFILRQLHVTENDDGSTLLLYVFVRAKFRYALSIGPWQTAMEERKILKSSCFSSTLSNQYMKRGTANEGTAVVNVSARPFLCGVFECSMVAKRDINCLACCPHDVGWIDVNSNGISETSNLEVS